jgi:dihydropyrimidinase
MPRHDLVLKGGRLLLPSGTVTEGDLAVDRGRIAALAAPGSLTDAEELVDVAGLCVMPGVIDAHIHLGHGADITRPRVARDADTETGAAAAGGVTTVISYVISADPYEAGIIDDVCNITSAGARVDFSFHLVISTEAQLAAVRTYVERYGIPTFKIFMYNRGGEGSRLGLPDIDDGFLFRLAEAAARSGGMICPHCENIEVAWVLRERLMSSDPCGKRGLAAWNASRPPFLEAEAVHRVGTLCRGAGSPVHMVHCSSAAGLEAALTQQALGANLSIETCTQYLTHTVGWEGGDIAKVNPPVRTASDAEALWTALVDGKIDSVATDHVHRNAQAKSGGIWKASPGFPGLETLLPVLLSEGHHKRGMSLGAVARVLSENPARIMGCHTKGAIAVGMDADVACVDLDACWLAEGATMRSDAGFSIYEGWRFKGKVMHTLVRGRFAFRDGSLCDEALGSGRFLRRRAPTSRKPRG